MLQELRARGLRLAVCSNWDWDLEPAVAEAGLARLRSTCSCRRRGPARASRTRGSSGTRSSSSSLAPDEVVFVGDTWGPDVDGPRALGMLPVYLERDGHWPDTTLPSAPAAEVARVRDLDRRAGAALEKPLAACAARADLRTRRTFCASSPFRPGPTSNSTACPSSRVRYPLPWMAEKWTNTSGPSSREMKP